MTTTPEEEQQNELTKILKQCKMIKQNDISNLSISIIAQFSLGYIVLCECGIGEVLILPSMEKHFEKFQCRDCQNECLSIRCKNCIDEENLFNFNPKMYDTSYPPETCKKCYYLRDAQQQQPICLNCSFICKGCLDYFCKQYHLKQICPTCSAEFCDKREWKFSVCIGCNKKICSNCKSVLCSEFGWIYLEDYDVCRYCYSSDILKCYPEIEDYKSCMEIIKLLNKYLECLPIKIIEKIALFANTNY